MCILGGFKKFSNKKHLMFKKIDKKKHKKKKF